MSELVPFTPEQKREWFLSLPGKACAAAVICLNSQKEMLVAKASYKNYWSLPGGAVDKDEAPVLAALRELKEETNISLSPEDVKFAGIVYYTAKPDGRDILHFLFLANNVTATAVPDGYEILETKWITPQEFRTLNGGAPHLNAAADIADGSDMPIYLESNR